VKISAWNIRRGGGKRLAQIVECLCRHDADIVVLTEFGGSNGPALCASLRKAGWVHQATSEPLTWENGVLVASRSPFLSSERPANGPTETERWLAVQFDGFTLIGLYFPLKETKQDFWRSVIQVASNHRDRPCLLIGDFNTTKHFVDEIGSAVPGSEFIVELESLGWTEIWREHNPKASGEYTWYHHKGNGFRIDHAYCSESLRPFATSAKYSHQERKSGISDHSILNVSLEISSKAAASS
jgi:exodeoxyribonuclease-3